MLFYRKGNLYEERDGSAPCRVLQTSLASLCGLDDNLSASSVVDMEDRLSYLEQRVQLQEDEIQLLKTALADALRRLCCCEEQVTKKKAASTKGERRLWCPAVAAFINRQSPG